MCNFWNKHSCVCFSAQCSRQSSSLARRMQLEPRTLGPTPSRHGENAPPPTKATGCCHPGRSVWRPAWGPSGSWRRNPGGAGATVPLQSRVEKRMLKNLQVFSLQDGVGHKWQDNLELSAVGGSSHCERSVCKDPGKVRVRSWSFPDGKTGVQERGIERMGQPAASQSQLYCPGSS